MALTGGAHQWRHEEVKEISRVKGANPRWHAHLGNGHWSVQLIGKEGVLWLALLCDALLVNGGGF